MAHRTKQVQKMVDYVNYLLKAHNINFSNMYDDNHIVNLYNNMCTLLLKAKCYEGYNEYFEKELVNADGTITKFNCLTGGSMTSQSEVPNSQRYIQLY